MQNNGTLEITKPVSSSVQLERARNFGLYLNNHLNDNNGEQRIMGWSQIEGLDIRSLLFGTTVDKWQVATSIDGVTEIKGEKLNLRIAQNGDIVLSESNRIVSANTLNARNYEVFEGDVSTGEGVFSVFRNEGRLLTEHHVGAKDSMGVDSLGRRIYNLSNAQITGRYELLVSNGILATYLQAEKVTNSDSTAPVFLGRIAWGVASAVQWVGTRWGSNRSARLADWRAEPGFWQNIRSSADERIARHGTLASEARDAEMKEMWSMMNAAADGTTKGFFKSCGWGIAMNLSDIGNVALNIVTFSLGSYGSVGRTSEYGFIKGTAWDPVVRWSTEILFFVATGGVGALKTLASATVVGFRVVATLFTTSAGRLAILDTAKVLGYSGKSAIIGAFKLGREGTTLAEWGIKGAGAGAQLANALGREVFGGLNAIGRGIANLNFSGGLTAFRVGLMRSAAGGGETFVVRGLNALGIGIKAAGSFARTSISVGLDVGRVFIFRNIVGDILNKTGFYGLLDRGERSSNAFVSGLCGALNKTLGFIIGRGGESVGAAFEKGFAK